MAEQQGLERQFAAWVAEQPAERGYNYMDNCGCALAAFLRETGVDADPHVGGFGWGDKDNADLNPFTGEHLVYALSRLPHTFGALSERLSVPQVRA